MLLERRRAFVGTVELVLGVRYCVGVVHCGVRVYLHLNELNVSLHTALICLDYCRFLFLLGSGEPCSIMHSSPLHVLSATSSQCRRIRIYNKDLYIRAGYCAARTAALFWASAGAMRDEHSIYWVLLFFMLSIDCIWTCFSIINVYENDWMIMHSSFFFFFVLEVFWEHWFSFYLFASKEPQ